MCGIAGEINFKDGVIRKTYHDKMLYSLKRRGPDENGIFVCEDAVLLHSRLAVIDIENGKQPMKYETPKGRFVICYNGELYNTKEIKKELEALGETFKTQSDTEVILRGYIVYGEDLLNKLNGIFAFAIYDEADKKLFVARDKMGVKPLFYAQRNGSFIFGSEIKALLHHPKIEAKIDQNGISELLFLGPGRTPGFGVFKDIFEIKAGHCGVFDENGFKERQYFTLADAQNNDTLEATILKTKHLVTDAIQRQLISDVPVGTFLSGGLDSSIISAVAARYFNENGKTLKTFSLDYKDNDKHFKSSKFQPNSDAEYIKIMQEFLKSEHINVVLDTEDIVNALYLSVDARDLPGMADIDSSLLLFCKEIKNHVTVALSGECADEIFGGYPWYRDDEIRSKYGFPWAQSTSYRQSFLNSDLANELNGELYVNKRYDGTVNATPKQDNLSPLESRMREMVFLNTNWFMQTLLDRKDRMSMYSGLEVRVPFCDYKIAEYMYTVPWEFKNLKGREKGLLRTAMEGILPESILWRKKSPYPKTHNPAYFEAVKNILKEILSDTNAPIFSIMNRPALESLLTTDKNEPWYGQLMTTPQTIAYIISLNYWLKKFSVQIV